MAARFGRAVEARVDEREVVGVDVDSAVGELFPAHGVPGRGELGVRVHLGEGRGRAEVLREKGDVGEGRGERAQALRDVVGPGQATLAAVSGKGVGVVVNVEAGGGAAGFDDGAWAAGCWCWDGAGGGGGR